MDLKLYLYEAKNTCINFNSFSLPNIFKSVLITAHWRGVMMARQYYLMLSSKVGFGMWGNFSLWSATTPNANCSCCSSFLRWPGKSYTKATERSARRLVTFNVPMKLFEAIKLGCSFRCLLSMSDNKKNISTTHVFVRCWFLRLVVDWSLLLNVFQVSHFTLKWFVFPFCLICSHNNLGIGGVVQIAIEQRQANRPLRKKL